MATCSGCVLLSRRRSVVLGPNWISVTGSLRRGEFAVLQLDPRHTNVALRLALHYAPPHAISLVARRDLPPRVGHRPAHGAAQPPREVLSERGDSPRLLSIPGRELGCGQRDGRRGEGAWPDLVVQRDQGWSALQREQVGPPFLPPPCSVPPLTAPHPPLQVGSLYERRWWNNTHGVAAACDAWFVALELWSSPPPPPPFLAGRYAIVEATEATQRDPLDVPNPLDPPTNASNESVAGLGEALEEEEQFHAALREAEAEPVPISDYELRAALEPQYDSFACRDCAPAPPLPPGQYVRFPLRPPPPPRMLDRYGEALSGDCEACDFALRGSAEAVVEPLGQRLRLVHSLEPKACAQAAVARHRRRPGSGRATAGPAAHGSRRARARARRPSALQSKAACPPAWAPAAQPGASSRRRYRSPTSLRLAT